MRRTDAGNALEKNKPDALPGTEADREIVRAVVERLAAAREEAST